MAFIRKRRPWLSQPQEVVEVGAGVRFHTLLSPVAPNPIEQLVSGAGWRTIAGPPFTLNGSAIIRHSVSSIGQSVEPFDSGAHFFRVNPLITGPRSWGMVFTPSSTDVTRGLWSIGPTSTSGLPRYILQANNNDLRFYGGGGYQITFAGVVVPGVPLFISWSLSTVTDSTSTVLTVVVNGVVQTATFTNSNDGSNEYIGIGYNTTAQGFFGEWWGTDYELSTAQLRELATPQGFYGTLFAPQSIWVPVSAGGGPTPAGTAAETDTSLTLSGVQLRAVGQAAETDAAQALVAVQIASTGRADETETALALTPVQITVAGLASETDAALALNPGASGTVGVALETDVAMALAAVQISTVGAASETDTALALTGLAGTAPGIANETDTAFALAAVQKLVAGAALEVDTALALSIPGGTLDLILKILVNRQELNPATGTFTLYDNDGTTVLYTTSAWADAAGTVPYSGGALRRIDALF